MSAFQVSVQVFHSLRKHLCFSRTAGHAFTCIALTLLQLRVKCATCMCRMWENGITRVCVCNLKLVYLFLLWPACLRYGNTSVARGSADVGANIARLLTLNHVGTRQTPCCCCCSYGLVSSSYWLLEKLKAGERLIKDTWVHVARQGPGCGFYWLPGLINTQSRRESLLAAMYCLDAFMMQGCRWVDSWGLGVFV